MIAWLRNPWGTAALPAADRGDLHLLVGRPGRDRDPVRVQQRPLAHELGGLLAALVLQRPRPERAGTTRALQGALKHTLVLAVICVADRDAARRHAGARPAALARPRQRHGQRAHAAPARDARDRDGRRAAAAVPAGLQRDRPRHDGAGDRPDHVHDLVRRRDGARPAGLDRARSTRRLRPTSARRPSTCSTACCCRCSRRPSWPAPRSSSRSRSTTSSSPSTSRATRARRPCRCCCTPRPAARRRRRSTRSRRSRSSITLGTLALVYFVYRRFAGGGAGAEAVAALEV